MMKILHSDLFRDFIQFEINDSYDTIDKACRSRLDLFDLPIEKYDKILYLDTDILITSDLNQVFDVCKDDVLYVLEEGTIDSDTDFWGKTLFGDEVQLYTDKTAFTSGILLFNRCAKIKELFHDIKNDMESRTYSTYFYDQPYIVYHAFKTGLYENKKLKEWVVNNDDNINSDKVIHHFPGTPGLYQVKLRTMSIFLNRLKTEQVYPYNWEKGMVFHLK
jgi:lipopolysaccharide biosynthesis glycosyltransferase